MMSTRLPAVANCRAIIAPDTPAPTMTTSYVVVSAIISSSGRKIDSEIHERRRRLHPVSEREVACPHRVGLHRLPHQASDVGILRDHLWSRQVLRETVP